MGRHANGLYVGRLNGLARTGQVSIFAQVKIVLRQRVRQVQSLDFTHLAMGRLSVAHPLEDDK